jgi:hypothetical protein
MPLVTRLQELHFKGAGVGANGILDCKFLVEIAHRAMVSMVAPFQPVHRNPVCVGVCVYAMVRNGMQW